MATDSTTWDKQACIHKALWRQRYVMASKEYLTNTRSFLKYFELEFYQLQLVKILCKLITIRQSDNRKKKGAIFMKQRVQHLALFIGNTCFEHISQAHGSAALC